MQTPATRVGKRVVDLKKTLANRMQRERHEINQRHRGIPIAFWSYGQTKGG
jgi:hypothetical protein